MQDKIKVSVTDSQELIKDIRLLAMCGKSMFVKYLYEPLLEAGWSADPSGTGSRKLIERLKRESDDPAYLHTIAPRCKKIVKNSMNESLAVLGESSIFFLERMQIHTAVSSSIEAIEFTDIIDPPLRLFSKKNNDKSEERFTAAVSDAEVDDLKTVIDPVKLGNDSEKIRLDSEIKRLYDNILIASQYYNIPKCRKLLSNYITRYSDSEDYARDDVEKLVVALDNRSPGFKDELNNTIAIDLYYRITQGVLKGDIKKTVTAIRKYGYIFEGNASIRYFYNIDRLERILYKMISEKGLWDELRNREE